MAYIGNIPAESYASFETETFSVSATTNYTLSHAVTNENDIRLVINGVVQQPGSGKAYTASNTTLTLTSATVSGDVMYAVYLGRALQTVNPPNASVGNSQTAPTKITGQTAETSIATDDTILIHDTSASALRKMTRANFVSGIGGAMPPAFFAYLGGSGGQSVSSDTITKVTINAQVFDTDNAFDSSSNYRFTPQTAGKYFVFASIMADSGSSSNLRENYIYLKKNGSTYIFQGSISFESNYIRQHVITNAAVVDMNGSSDYLELFGRIKVDSGTPLFESNTQWGQITNFGAYKIIE